MKTEQQGLPICTTLTVVVGRTHMALGRSFCVAPRPVSWNFFNRVVLGGWTRRTCNDCMCLMEVVRSENAKKLSAVLSPQRSDNATCHTTMIGAIDRDIRLAWNAWLPDRAQAGPKKRQKPPSPKPRTSHQKPRPSNHPKRRPPPTAMTRNSPTSCPVVLHHVYTLARPTSSRLPPWPGQLHLGYMLDRVLCCLGHGDREGTLHDRTGFPKRSTTRVGPGTPTLRHHGNSTTGCCPFRRR